MKETLISKIRNGKVYITTNLIEIEVIKRYHEKILHANKLDFLD